MQAIRNLFFDRSRSRCKWDSGGGAGRRARRGAGRRGCGGAGSIGSHRQSGRPTLADDPHRIGKQSECPTGVWVERRAVIRGPRRLQLGIGAIARHVPGRRAIARDCWPAQPQVETPVCVAVTGLAISGPVAAVPGAFFRQRIGKKPQTERAVYRRAKVRLVAVGAGRVGNT